MFSRFVKGVRIHSQYRNLWTQRTVSNTDLTKCVSQSLTGLPNKPIDVCVALVSRSFSANDILKLNTEFLKHINPKIFIGAVVDRVPSPDSGGHGLSVLIGQEEDATGFIVEDTADRKKIKSVSVGRWGRVQDFNRFEFEENDIDKFGWEGFKSVSRNVHDHSLIPQLQNLNCVPQFAWIVSDHEPYQLIETLDHHLPQTTKCGLIGSSTPFITGTPYTLFYNGKTLSGGTIGFVSSSTPKLQPEIQHHALEVIGRQMTITRCRGNIILDLDESSATGLLLDLLNKGHNANISKDKEFYLGICLDEPVAQLASVHRVTSGDPSKGNMSIDTTIDFQVGQKVQFLHRVDTKVNAVPDAAETDNRSRIICSVTDKDATLDFSETIRAHIVSTTPDIFGGSSENGVLVGLPNQTTFVLDAPYSSYVVKM